VNPQATPNVAEEDASVIFLRVMDHADLPNAEETRALCENAQRVSGEVAVIGTTETFGWTTHNLLSYAGVRCRVIGTFYMGNLGERGNPVMQLCFGSDISNYYPNRGLKVFKPRADVLTTVVNFRDPIIYGQRGFRWFVSAKFATPRQTAHSANFECLGFP